MKKEDMLEFDGCDCLIPKSEAKYRSKSKTRPTGGYVCPEHGTDYTCRVQFCQVCGVAVRTPRMQFGRSKEVCDDHVEFMRRIYQERYLNSLPEGHKYTPVESSDEKAVRRVLSLPTRQPGRVGSVAEARQKKVNCIPSDKLFRFHLGLFQSDDMRAAG